LAFDEVKGGHHTRGQRATAAGHPRSTIAGAGAVSRLWVSGVLILRENESELFGLVQAGIDTAAFNVVKRSDRGLRQRIRETPKPPSVFS
jgi:hypothetical protein